MIRITFHGGSRDVTGANYLIETDKSKVLVDCGLIQGGLHVEERNFAPFAYDPKTVDALLLTHAHIDHTGRAPKLFKEGFLGKIISTYPTHDLLKVMLEDSQGLMEAEAEREKREPLYTKRDVERALEHSYGVDYGKIIEITDDIRVRFRDAGHILGSAIIEMWVKSAEGEKKIVFSGDLGNSPVPLLRPTELIDEAEYVLVEAVYGDRIHEDREERKNVLEDAIEDTIAKGGTLMIPAFAIERIQEMLYELNSLVENRRIPPIPIFIDSPMAINATAVYRKYPQYYNTQATHLIKSGDKLFDFPRLKFTYTSEESIAINDVPPPKVILAGSGMSTGGRILHHERRYLPDPNSMLLIIGYQVAGSLGRRVLDGADEVRIFGEPVAVRARVRAIGGYSAHADQEALAHWVGHIHKGGKLKKVFIVQGEEGPALALRQILRDNLGIDAVAPVYGESFDL